MKYKNITSIKNSIPIFVAIFFSSCLGKPDFSKTPAITFKSITLSAPTTPYGDDILVAIEFQDGDGDLGTSDTAIKSFNLGALKKQQGKFSPITFPSGFTFGGNFPPLSTVPNSPIKGELQNKVPFAYKLSSSFPRIKEGDTLKFTVQLTDRAGNKSNIVESNEVILGKYQ
jgi:hypothetical protein